MTATQLEFVLPPELEARRPPETRGLARDGVRLLVSDRRSGDVHHAAFADIANELVAGDLLVYNDSATLPAALVAHRGTDRSSRCIFRRTWPARCGSSNHAVLRRPGST